MVSLMSPTRPINITFAWPFQRENRSRTSFKATIRIQQYYIILAHRLRGFRRFTHFVKPRSAYKGRPSNAPTYYISCRVETAFQIIRRAAFAR